MRIKKTLPLLVAAVVAMPAILNAQTSDRLPAASNASGQLRDSMPATWTLEPQYTQTTPTSDGWWNRFSDPTLQALMQRAVDNNFNVLAAAQRIEQARQTIRQTKAGYYPSFNIQAGWDKVQTSGLNDVVHVHTERDSYWHGDIGMNWEIDLFGRIRRQLKADKAGYKASLADYDAVLVSLCSDLASTYVDLRVAQQQLLLTEGTASEQDSLLNMAKLRYEAGLVSELDVVTARIMIKQTRATIPSLRAQIAADINAIPSASPLSRLRLSCHRVRLWLPAYRPTCFVAVPMWCRPSSNLPGAPRRWVWQRLTSSRCSRLPVRWELRLMRPKTSSPKTLLHGRLRPHSPGPYSMAWGVVPASPRPRRR